MLNRKLLAVLILLLFTVILANCKKSTTEALEQCAKPVMSPETGVYYIVATVSITSATDGAAIYYTMNGSEPTTSSTLYTNLINVSESSTIKAVAYKAGMTKSQTASEEYHIITSRK